MSGDVLAIVGATGAVGQKLLKVIDERIENIKGLRLFASAKSAGQEISFRGDKIQIEELKEDCFRGIDYAFFSAGSPVSLEYCKQAVKSGAIVIDNTNAYRMAPDVPLVVPEANPQALRNHKGLIANPNCSTIQMITALAPIQRVNPIKRIVVTTYQSVSGTGNEAIRCLKHQANEILKGEDPSKGVYPHPIAFNLIPQIDVYDPETGMYKEEEKMINETRKIFESDIQVCPTTVRVPVFFCHSEAINIQLSQQMTLEELKSLLKSGEDIRLLDEPENSIYPTPLQAQDKDEVFVGRLRKDPSAPNCFNLWVVADNLRRGAATNAVKIYQKLKSL